jgi:hypothetical protein
MNNNKSHDAYHRVRDKWSNIAKISRTTTNDLNTERVCNNIKIVHHCVPEGKNKVFLVLLFPRIGRYKTLNAGLQKKKLEKEMETYYQGQRSSLLF